MRMRIEKRRGRREMMGLRWRKRRDGREEVEKKKKKKVGG